LASSHLSNFYSTHHFRDIVLAKMAITTHDLQSRGGTQSLDLHVSYASSLRHQRRKQCEQRSLETATVSDRLCPWATQLWPGPGFSMASGYLPWKEVFLTVRALSGARTLDAMYYGPKSERILVENRKGRVEAMTRAQKLRRHGRLCVVTYRRYH
jgi:hypothetical protein